MRVIYTGLFCLLASTLNAATLIQSKDNQQQLSNIYIEGQKVRIEMPENEGYVVMNARDKTMKVVMHQQRSVMDMSGLMQNETAPSSQHPVKTSTRKLGKGPRIAGYPTDEYGLYANKQYCGSLFISDKAMRDLKLESLAQSFSQMQNNIQNHMSQMTGMHPAMLNDPCDFAETAADQSLMKLGFPLKSIDRERQQTSVVTRIDRRAKLPANAFAIPAGYSVTNPDKMIKDAMQQMQPQMQQMQQQMQEAMKNMPDELKQMMQQQLQQ